MKKTDSFITSTLAVIGMPMLRIVPLLLLWLYVEIVNFKRRRSARALHYRSFDGQYNSPIYKLPVEILQSIASTLPPAGAAAFALSSGPILFALGERYLKVDKTQRFEFLELLERELPDYILCQECTIFHRRTALGQVGRTRDGHLHKHGELYASRPLERGHGFLFKDAQQIMNHHRYGFAHGPYAEDVKKFTTLESTSHGARALQHEELRIVRDMLLLQTHTAFQFRNDNARGREWARNFRVVFCPHISIHNTPYTYPQTWKETYPQTWREIFLKCKTCNTEIRFRAIALDSYRDEYAVTQWFNLGRCRSQPDAHWRAIACEPNLREVQYIKPENAIISLAFESNSPASIELREQEEDFEKLEKLIVAHEQVRYSRNFPGRQDKASKSQDY